MPKYDFRCKLCKVEFERTAKISEKDAILFENCSSCGKVALEQFISKPTQSISDMKEDNTFRDFIESANNKDHKRRG